MSRLGRRSFVLAIVFVLLAATAAANAVPPPGKGGGKGGGGKGSGENGIVLALDHATATLQVISPDGAGKSTLPCAGLADLSHGTIGGVRWLIYSKALPGGTELVALDYADAVAGNCNEIVLTNFDGSVIPRTPRWSPNGSMVAFVGETNGVPDLWIADVTTTGSIQLANEHVLVAGAQPLGPVSWSSASDVLTYSRIGPNGYYSIYIADPVNGTELLVSPDLNQHEFNPAFSPGPYQVAFMRITDGAAIQRHDVFVGWLEGEKDGFQWQAITGVLRITDEKTMNITQADYPAWSPDARHIVISGWESSITGDRELYRVAVGSKRKAKKLTADKLTGPSDGDRFTTSVWRTSP